MFSHECRPSGLDHIGEVPWGTHLCHFFQTKEDILDVLIPYFRAGLESNEACMWVTSAPLDVSGAREALCAAVPAAERALASGQLEILAHADWYLDDGAFSADRVIDGWAKRVESALRAGRAGLRISGNTFWLEQAGWGEFVEYEGVINRTIGRFRMMAVCTYSLDRCGASEIIEVANNHHFALVKRSGAWEVLESSDRRRVAEALRASEERYRRMIEAAGEGMLILDAAGRIKFANDRIAELLGTSAAHLLGGPLRDLVHEDDWPAAEACVAGADGLSQRFDVRLCRPNGPVSWAIVSMSPITDADDRPSGALLMVTDITGRKRAEVEREQLLARERAARAEAEGLVQLRERIMAVLGHDLRQPLNVISTSAALMSLNASSGTLEQKRVDMIQGGVRRMDAMIDDLLDLARGRSGGIPVTPRTVDLRSLCQEALDWCQALYPDRVIRLELEGDCTGMWDPSRLSQVLSNLTRNALLHGAPNTPVVLRVQGCEADVVLEVHNLGNPIPPEELGAIFEPFRRGHATRPSSGLGLGLFIVSEIVRAHGGDVSVESSAARGTTFAVRLPRRAPCLRAITGVVELPERRAPSAV